MYIVSFSVAHVFLIVALFLKYCFKRVMLIYCGLMYLLTMSIVVETEQCSDASGSATLIMVTPVTASVVVLVIVGIVLLIWRRRRLSARPGIV